MPIPEAPASSPGSSGGNQGADTTPMTWATLAAAGVTGAAEQAMQDGGADMNDLILAARWMAFENWVATHSVSAYSDMAPDAYDAWAKMQLRRIVLEGKMP